MPVTSGSPVLVVMAVVMVMRAGRDYSACIARISCAPKWGNRLLNIYYTISVDGIILLQKDIKTSKMDHQNWVPIQGVDQQLVVDQLFGC